jgi:hypothetical protein
MVANDADRIEVRAIAQCMAVVDHDDIVMVGYRGKAEVTRTSLN